MLIRVRKKRREWSFRGNSVGGATNSPVSARLWGLLTHILTLVLAAFWPLMAIAAPAPAEQDFVITAYYSPLPGQCCYVRGSYEADVALNGEGTHGADGTPVYAGMAAAPSSLDFGTRIELPGIGTVTVHDRGGAIVDKEDGSKRLDLWVGHGEEGLARALAFGVERVRGTVYPVGSAQPAESLALESLPSPQGKLRSYIVAGASPSLGLLSLMIRPGDRTFSVSLFQEALQKAGYFSDAVSGFFGPVTQRSWDAFLSDFGLGPASAVTSDALATLQAAAGWKSDLALPRLHKGSPRSDVASVQRTLRFLGAYRGRTDGIYDDRIAAALLAFQKKQGLVGSDRDPGAGRLGPQTRRKIALLWKRAMIATRVKSLLTLRRVDELLVARTSAIGSLSIGDRGDDVRALQRMLADQGFFDAADINGNFGEKTKQAVAAFQLKHELIKSDLDPAAGYVGPGTLMALRRFEQARMIRTVRAEGWGAL